MATADFEYLIIFIGSEIADQSTYMRNPIPVKTRLPVK